MHDSVLTPPRWMRVTLWLAAAYNILWGLYAICFPMHTFQWAGFEQLPLYPELWQCIGMIVGVYGIGYAIAATDPFRHWPIILVGLLGKVFGPIGFLDAAINGRFPWKMGLTNLTNDLIWWVPFTLILWAAARANQSRPATPVDPLTDDPLNTLRSQHGYTLNELSRHAPTLVVFLRHSGCTFCREALADLSRDREAIEAEGVQLALVHLGQESDAGFFSRYRLGDVNRFTDPDARLYRAMNLPLGRFSQLLGPRVWWRGLLSFLRGNGFGRIRGNGFQMPGVFLLRDGQVLRSHAFETAGDRPDYQALACPLSPPVPVGK